MQVNDGLFYPAILAGICDEGNVKIQLAVKGFPVGLAVAVDKIASAGYLVAILP